MNPPDQIPPPPYPPQTGYVESGIATTTVSTAQARRTIRLPDIDWVDIPDGEFLYQQGERRSLPSFRIARYPITNIQYQTFIDAGGYRDQRWWQDLERPEPEESRWPQANRPRTNVNWYEAVAFCRWLSAQLGDELRLPSEEQWERAARGREGWQYPWGKTYESGRANIDETWSYDRVGEWNLQQTTAVGVYPHGASSEGVLDLSGNVWEWCLNQYEHPEQTKADTSSQARVLRGGSWYGYTGFARLASRRGQPWRPGQRLRFSPGVVCPHSLTRCLLPTYRKGVRVTLSLVGAIGRAGTF